MISTEVKNHIILFHDKSKLLLTEKQAGATIEALNFGNSTHLRIEGQLYSKGAIAKIISLDDYYKQYPDQKPDQRSTVEELMLEQGMIEKPAGYAGVINKSSGKGLQEMMKGFLKSSTVDKKLYKAMLDRSEGKTISITDNYHPRKFETGEEFKTWYRGQKVA